jgi:hypothetical protein
MKAQDPPVGGLKPKFRVGRDGMLGRPGINRDWNVICKFSFATTMSNRPCAS